MSETTKEAQKLSEEERLRLAKYDCLPCRITGAGALGGLGVYMLVEGRRQLAAEKHSLKRWEFLARKGSIHGIGISLVLAGLYRLVN